MKKFLIIAFILIVILFLLFIFSMRYGGNIKYKIQMYDIKKDIVIEKCQAWNEYTGYASTHNYYYVDLEKQIIYHVEDYYIFGIPSSFERKGHNYSLKGKKYLTSSEISEIKRLTTLPSDYNSENYTSKEYDNSEIGFALNPLIGIYYYNITYNGKTRTLSDSTASSLIQIINDMK